MNFRAFASSCDGPKYKTKGFVCQDYSCELDLGDIKVIAVADGHGSNDCFLSDIGAKLAVETASNMIREYKIEGCFHNCSDQEDNIYLDAINENMKVMPITTDKKDEAHHVDYNNWLQRRQNVQSVMLSSDNIKTDNRETLEFCKEAIELFKCQFWMRWRTAVKEDWNSRKTNHWEKVDDNNIDAVHDKRYQKASDKYKTRYSKEEKNYLYTAYGTTFILALATKYQILLLQIGDGTCVVIRENGKFSTPVPIDEDNFLNVTVSLCEENAYKKIRHVVLDNEIPELAPVAVFLSSDGLDDCYPVYNNDRYLYCLYYEILKKLSVDSSKEHFDEIKKEIEESLLPGMTSQGSQDDISLAFLVNSDMELLTDALKRVDLNDINPDYDDKLEQDRRTNKLDKIPVTTNSVKKSIYEAPQSKIILPPISLFRNAEDFKNKEDYDNAFIGYKNSDSQGNFFASYWLAWCYKYGKGTKADEAEAYRYRKKAFEELKKRIAGAGFISAEDIKKLQIDDVSKNAILYVFGQYYEREEKNVKEAKVYYKAAAEFGYQYAQYRLGSLLYREQPEKAENWLRKAADQGNEDAAYLLGYIFYKFYKDSRKKDAKLYLKLSANKGHIEAKYLFYCLCKRDGCISREAETFLFEAAEKEYLLARLEVVIGYSKCREDYDRNIRYYNDSIKDNKLVDRNDKYNAQYRLGCLCYNLGKLAEAEKFFNEAVKSNVPEFRFGLYCVLLDMRKNDKADRILSKLAEEGYSEALDELFNLGNQALENGKVGEAKEKFKKAAKYGHKEALASYSILREALKGYSCSKVDRTSVVEYFLQKYGLAKEYIGVLVDRVGLLFENSSCDSNQQIEAASGRRHSPSKSSAVLKNSSTMQTQVYIRTSNSNSSVESSGDKFFQFGETYYKNKDYKNAVSYYMSAAEKYNHIGAMRKLVECYIDGTGVPRDLYQASIYEDRANKLEQYQH